MKKQSVSHWSFVNKGGDPSDIQPSEAGHTADQLTTLQTLLSMKKANPKRYNPVAQVTLLPHFMPCRPL